MLDEKALEHIKRSVLELRPGKDADAIECKLTDQIFATTEALWRVARAAGKIVFAQEREYAPGSKKAALKAELEQLKEPPPPWKTETPNESAPVPSTEKTASMEPEPILKSTNPEESGSKPSADGGNG